MSTTTLHPLASDYLRSVGEAARGLPRTDRQELLADLEAHLHEATVATSSDADVRVVLQRLGDPGEIVDAYQADLRGARADLPPPQAGGREYAAIALLLLGGILGVIGWGVGVVLLWMSPVWRTRDKWLGTLVIPGGLAVPGAFAIILATATAKTCHTLSGGAQQCTPVDVIGLNPPVIVLLVLLTLAPLATAAFLLRQSR
ncbi:MAG: hypothetical protein J2P22_04420 [Nocardioides sp.]|nr:hypothetical protein [Nocardioides sp.]